MKTCSQCNQFLPLDAFSKQATGKLGHRADCKECVKRFTRTKEGLVKTLYTQQKAKSKNRGYQPPKYTEKELLDWMDAQPTFQSLYDSWVASGYSSNLRPSVDRISDTTSYTMSNIQLMTWEENSKKAYESYLTGDTTKKCAAVDMLDLEGNFMKRFISVSEAAREFNGIPGNITSAILQRVSKRSNGTTYTTLTAYGHKWRYSTILNDNSEVI